MEPAMNTIPNPGSGIFLESLPNLRDLGGWRTTGAGTVRRGLLFRSTSLHGLSREDARTLNNLGVRTIYDLRTAGEIAARPDRLPDGATLAHLDILADATGSSPARAIEALLDPVAAEEVFGGGRNAETYEEGYRDIVSLPSARNGYRRLFLDLLDPGTLAALFHCTTGKDRTGWAAAALLLLFGVPEEDVFNEYLLTNDQLLPQIQSVFNKFAAAGGDPALLVPVLGVQRNYLETALDEMRTRFATIEGYFADGLGIGAPVQDEIRRVFTTGIND